MIIKPLQSSEPVDRSKARRKSPSSTDGSEHKFESLLDDIDVVEISSKDDATEDDQKRRKNSSDNQSNKDKKLDRFA